MFLHQCWSLFFNYRLENCNCFNKETQTQLFSCDFYEFLLDSLTHFIPFPKVQKRSPRSVLSKKCSEKFRKFYRKTPVPESFFNKVVGLKPATLFKKETLAQVFSCEFCEISKNTFFYRAPPVAASESSHWRLVSGVRVSFKWSWRPEGLQLY